MSRFEDLSRVISRKLVTPRIPPGYQPKVENDEQDAPDSERDDSSSWSAFIVYTDAKGVDSMRRITCKQISGFGRAETVITWCHERAAPRTFRIDRIRDLVCAETGEVLDPIPHFEALRLRGALNIDDKALTELARVMVFLARCDGEYHPLEEAALATHVERYALRFGGSDRQLETVVKRCGQLAPDGGDVIAALRKFERSHEGAKLCRFVLDCGAGIIDADGRHADEEISWALELSAALKTVADR